MSEYVCLWSLQYLELKQWDNRAQIVWQFPTEAQFFNSCNWNQMALGPTVSGDAPSPTRH